MYFSENSFWINIARKTPRAHPPHGSKHCESIARGAKKDLKGNPDGRELSYGASTSQKNSEKTFTTKRTLWTPHSSQTPISGKNRKARVDWVESADQKLTQLEAAWKAIFLTVVQPLLETTARRFKGVIDAKGYATKY
uniref:Uncharacterized protein n=1 Tax=Caenorhabditis japonica TaxID=281687 RepID=A0A8R1EPZ7_CAEJA